MATLPVPLNRLTSSLFKRHHQSYPYLTLENCPNSHPSVSPCIKNCVQKVTVCHCNTYITKIYYTNDNLQNM